MKNVLDALQMLEYIRSKNERKDRTARWAAEQCRAVAVKKHLNAETIQAIDDFIERHMDDPHKISDWAFRACQAYIANAAGFTDRVHWTVIIRKGGYDKVVVKVEFHHEDTGYCRTTFKEHSGEKFFNRSHEKGGGWSVCAPSNGFFESSHSVSNDVVFEVVDSNSSFLFAESNVTLGAFCSIKEKTKEVAGDWSKKLSLRTYDEWRAWITGDMAPEYIGGDWENWAYVPTKTHDCELIDVYQHLGISFAVLGKTQTHNISKKKWRSIFIEKQGADSCEAICGFVFNTGDGNCSTCACGCGTLMSTAGKTGTDALFLPGHISILGQKEICDSCVNRIKPYVCAACAVYYEPDYRFKPSQNLYQREEL